MKNLRDYDKLTIAEKRMIAPFASEYLAECLARQEVARKNRKKKMYLITIEELGEENNGDFTECTE